MISSIQRGFAVTGAPRERSPMASESSSPVWQPTAVRVVTLLDARTGTMPCCGSAPLHQSLDTRTDAAPFRGTVRLPKSPDPSLLYVAAGSLALHDEAGRARPGRGHVSTVGHRRTRVRPCGHRRGWRGACAMARCVLRRRRDRGDDRRRSGAFRRHLLAPHVRRPRGRHLSRSGAASATAISSGMNTRASSLAAVYWA